MHAADLKTHSPEHQVQPAPPPTAASAGDADSEAEIQRLHGELERTRGKKIVLERQLDPTLLGGAYVRIGDHVVDRSVKTLLEVIANQLYEVSV